MPRNKLIGKALGPYKILEGIGRGGMATVHRAFDTRLQRTVAVKVLHEHLRHDSKLVQRFEREAKLAAKLDHPNIIPIYDVGEEKGLPYFAMQYVDYTLHQILRQQGPLPLTQTVDIIRQIASALDHAHDRGYIHRDVKPSNILVSKTGQAMLSDFGIVKAADGTTLTDTGTMIGTPEYMSPEQIRGLQVDRRSDIYSLGIVCYEMLAGRVPFSGDTARVLYGHVWERPEPLHQVNPQVPLAVQRVVERALAKRPRQRYATAGEMVQALKRAAAWRAVEEPTTWVARTPGARTGPDKLSAFVARVRQLFSQSPPILIGVVAAMVVLVGGVLFFSQPAPVPTPTPTLTRTSTATATPKTPTPTVTPVAPTNTPTFTPTPPPATPTPSPAGMVLIPGGEFLTGSSQGQIDYALQLCQQHCRRCDCLRSDFEKEHPQQSVYLAPFQIDIYEVTNAQYRQCVQVEVCGPPQTTASESRDFYFGNPQFDNYPVIYVSWYDAQTYCEWMGKRLPTNAEWEKAARGSNGYIFPWGNQWDGDRLNFCDASCRYGQRKDWASNDGYGDTAPVGSYPSGASPFGVYDMAGNVSEWMADSYDASGTHKVVRGGSWASVVINVRPAVWWGHFLYEEVEEVGFRCAR